MADKLLKLIILVLFICFRPASSEEELDSQGLSEANGKDSQDVKKESEESQTPEAETAESKGSPGILSQVFSELAAPFLDEDEDEAEFLPEDSSSVNPSSENNNKEEGSNKKSDDYPSSSENRREEDKNQNNEDGLSVKPSLGDNSKIEEKDNDNNNNNPFVDSLFQNKLKKDDKNRDSSNGPSVEPPSEEETEDSDEQPSVDTSSEKNKDKYDSPSVDPSLEEKIKDNDNSFTGDLTSDNDVGEADDKQNKEQPQFASSKYMSSVTEDSNSGPTVDQQSVTIGEEKSNIVWPDVASVPAMQSGSTPDAGDQDSRDKHIQVGSRHSQHGELSDEELEHLRVKNKFEVEHETSEVEGSDEGDVVEIPKEKDEKIEVENIRSNSEERYSMEKEGEGSKIDKEGKQILQEKELVIEEENSEIDQTEIGRNEKSAGDKGNTTDEDLNLKTLRKHLGGVKQQTMEEKDNQQRLEFLKKQQAEDETHDNLVDEQKPPTKTERQVRLESLEKFPDEKKGDHTISNGQKLKSEENIQHQKRKAGNKQQSEMMTGQKKFDDEVDQKEEKEDVEQSVRFPDKKKHKEKRNEQPWLESSRKQGTKAEQQEMQAEEENHGRDEQAKTAKSQQHEGKERFSKSKRQQMEKDEMTDERRRKDKKDRQLKMESLRKELAELEQSERLDGEQSHKDRKDQQEKMETEEERMGADRNHNKAESKEGHLEEKQDYGRKTEEKIKEGKNDEKLEEEELKRKIASDRKMVKKMAEEYRFSKRAKQPKVQKGHKHFTQSLVKKKEVPPKVDQASILLPVPVTSTIGTGTPSPSVKKLAPSKTEITSPVSGSTNKMNTDHHILLNKEMVQPTTRFETTTPAPSSTTKTITDHHVLTNKEKIQPTATSEATTPVVSSATETIADHVVLLTKEKTQPNATFAATSSSTFTIAAPSDPQGAEVSEAPKVVLSEAVRAGNASRVSPYGAFMVSFRSFHERSFNAFLSYWPTIKNTTSDVLGIVGLDSVFDQLCHDLADVHPLILFLTFLFGTLGFLYLFWSFTLGSKRYGAIGPNPRDVVRSKDARIRILEEELKAADDEKLALMHERDTAVKEKHICEDQLKDTHIKIERLQKEIKMLKEKEEEVNEFVTKITNAHADAEAEIKEKGDRIADYENMILQLETKIEAKQTEIGKLQDHVQEQQRERQANQQLVDGLNSQIEQTDEENKKLERMLQEVKDSKENLRAEFDEQVLRLTGMEQQYNYKRDECELLQDCLKQIKVNSSADEDKEDDEETDPQELEKRVEIMMDVAKAKADLKKSLESQKAMESELEDHRRTRKVLENEVEEIREQLVQLKSKADQAALSQREKEIELEALQKYFKSTEVELHRKLTAEESARISTENQLQSEQAKASTAVVDADKYRQLYLKIQKQIEEIDQSKKEQLSNMETKAHQNWLDYRAAANEAEALKEENDLLRRKLYDMEVRGSRPSSSASSNQMNHVDGRDSPRHSPMTGPPGHGSPVPFAPMMGPPPPPPVMFPVQRRHPAEMLMTPPPPRPPFPPPGHATPPPTTSTPQTSKPDSYSADGSPRLPPPPPPSMGGFGPRPIPPMMGMPRFPLPPPMIPPPPVSGGQGPRIFRPSGPLPPPVPVQGPRQSSENYFNENK